MYSYGGDVSAAVHDGELGLRDLKDGVQHAPVMQVGPAVNHPGEVVGDENGRVAVAVVVRVAGQLNDAIVCDADAAAQVEFAQTGRLI